MLFFCCRYNYWGSLSERSRFLWGQPLLLLSPGQGQDAGGLRVHGVHGEHREYGRPHPEEHHRQYWMQLQLPRPCHVSECGGNCRMKANFEILKLTQHTSVCACILNISLSLFLIAIVLVAKTVRCSAQAPAKLSWLNLAQYAEQPNFKRTCCIWSLSVSKLYVVLFHLI